MMVRMGYAILVLSIAASTAYIAEIPIQPRWAIKALGVFLLAVLARRRPLLALGLLFGSAGDALLDYSKQTFLAGLGSFLIGHLFYIAHFLRHGTRRLSTRILAVLPLYCAVVIWFIGPKLGDMTIPVLLYLIINLASAGLAIRCGLWTLTGAVLFVLSDTLLAYGLYCGDFPARGFLVWTTYYSAQLLLSQFWLDLRPRAALTT